MKPLHRIIERAKSVPMRIALSESDDPRIIDAAVRAAFEGIAHITLVGSEDQVSEFAGARNIDLKGVGFYDPNSDPIQSLLEKSLYDLRCHKGMTLNMAAKLARDPLVCANLLVRNGYADGTVSGAVRTTAEVVRTALQVLGAAPESKLVSSFFLMMLCEPFHKLKGGIIFSDCALVVDPSVEELAAIAIAASDNARDLLMEEPKVAMLSFSTSGSASHSSVDKVIEATAKVKQVCPALDIDGDIQLDAAIVADIAARKVPNSSVKGKANVLIFPSLEAGNIGYKLAERIGGAKAIGPLLQGLAHPANDLSRGCTADDVFYVIAITAVQAQRVRQFKVSDSNSLGTTAS